MCFFVPYGGLDSEPLIAPEGGIKCFKVVCTTDIPEVYSSLYRGFQYQKSKQCPEIPLIVKEEPVGDFIIDSGYHSYRSIEACLNDLGRSPEQISAIIVRCLIPAGSQYYENLEDDEYVSSSIILLGEES